MADPVLPGDGQVFVYEQAIPGPRGPQGAPGGLAQPTSVSFMEDGTIVKTTGEQVEVVTFEADGNILHAFSGPITKTILTRFLEDGSVVEEEVPNG